MTSKAKTPSAITIKKDPDPFILAPVMLLRGRSMRWVLAARPSFGREFARRHAAATDSCPGVRSTVARHSVRCHGTAEPGVAGGDGGVERERDGECAAAAAVAAGTVQWAQNVARFSLNGLTSAQSAAPRPLAPRHPCRRCNLGLCAAQSAGPKPSRSMTPGPLPSISVELDDAHALHRWIHDPSFRAIRSFMISLVPP
jgi:hypothetical protein